MGVATALLVVVSTLNRIRAGESPVAGAVNSSGELPLVRDRPEGCLLCHHDVMAGDAAHQPAAIGCSSCHLGDASAHTAQRAHRGLVLVPGNLDNARLTCGQAGCHETIIPRVGHSIMATMAGVVAADHRAFGEPPPAEVPHVLDLTTTAADSHQRQLCASCHLGMIKAAWGPTGELSRGGGCNACHLVYSQEARRQLEVYTARQSGHRVPTSHPGFSITAGSASCFGCHSRSSRISTSYEGWSEVHAPTDPAEHPAAGPAAAERRLADGRIFTRQVPDVHAELGFECIDCHPVNEVMGRGNNVRRKTDQVHVRCEDCHASRPTTVALSQIDPETFELLRLRNRRVRADDRLVITTAGDVLTNTTIGSDGVATLTRKRDGQAFRLRPPSSACDRDRAHRRLSCDSCHTAWAPRCVSCHTAFDPRSDGFDHLAQQFVRGEWQETAGDFEAVPPTLGVQTTAGDADGKAGVIRTFVPGMIIELDRNRDPAWPPDCVVRRWYAPISAHTTRREIRSCVSCHTDPVALGFGAGTLRFAAGAGRGRWEFTPAKPLLDDGLPADAWTGFLMDRTDDVSSHPYVRPLNADEQQRILRVGACLTCHDGASAVMQSGLHDFAAAVKAKKKACVDYPVR